jgi:hypothetical protein
LFLRERHSHPSQSSDAFDRVVQRFTELDRGSRSVLPQRLGHVSHDLRRLGEDVVPRTRGVLDVRERQEKVFTRDDRIVGLPRVFLDRRR